MTIIIIEAGLHFRVYCPPFNTPWHIIVCVPKIAWSIADPLHINLFLIRYGITCHSLAYCSSDMLSFSANHARLVGANLVATCLSFLFFIFNKQVRKHVWVTRVFISNLGQGESCYDDRIAITHSSYVKLSFVYLNNMLIENWSQDRFYKQEMVEIIIRSGNRCYNQMAIYNKAKIKSNYF